MVLCYMVYKNNTTCMAVSKLSLHEPQKWEKENKCVLFSALKAEILKKKIFVIRNKKDPYLEVSGYPSRQYLTFINLIMLFLWFQILTWFPSIFLKTKSLKNFIKACMEFSPYLIKYTLCFSQIWERKKSYLSFTRSHASNILIRLSLFCLIKFYSFFIPL